MTKSSFMDFRVHSYDSDAFGYICPTSIGGYLQEAAAESASAFGFGLADLNRSGLTWVLVREQYELDAPIRVGDSLTIETWPSGVERRAALRDFRLLRNGREIGRALTSWLVLETASRRPIRPSQVLPQEFHPETLHVLPVWREPIPMPCSRETERRFPLRFSDIDVNLHVTNTSYVSWAIETVEESTWRERWICGLDIQFLAECSLGAWVAVHTGSLESECLVHSMTREQDSKEIARACTRWASRPAPAGLFP